MNRNLSRYLPKVWRSYLYASVIRLSLTVEKAFLIRFICYAYISNSFIFMKSLNNSCDNSFDCDSIRVQTLLYRLVIG